MTSGNRREELSNTGVNANDQQRRTAGAPRGTFTGIGHMSMTIRLTPLLALAAAASAVSAGVIELRGPQGEQPVHVTGLSANGRYVAGRVIIQGVHLPARWDLATGEVLTIPLPPNVYSAETTSVSADGSVGFGLCAIDGTYHAFRWTAAEGFTHTFAEGMLPTRGSGTRDGSTYVGNTSSGPFRWNLTDGFQPIEFPAAMVRPRINGASADGSVIVGNCYYVPAGFDRGFRMVNGTISILEPGPGAESYANRVSPSGLIIGGEAPPEKALVWIGSSITPIAVSPPGDAIRVSFGPAVDTGAKVFGLITYGFGSFAGMWTQSDGLVNLNNHLVARGVDLGSYLLTGVVGVSDDAQVILAVDQHEDWSGLQIPAKAIVVTIPSCGTSDFNGDGDFGTDHDIEAFFACLAGNCCASCWRAGADFDNDGDSGTDQDIEAFFRVLAGQDC